MEERAERWMKHYNDKQQILLVGEGDFSFSLCLAQAFGSASNMTATSLDAIEKLGLNYMEATKNIGILKRRGCTVLHQVDVHTMSNDYTLRLKQYDRIIFNFPHAGSRFIGCEFEINTIRQHQHLVRGYLGNARELVKEDGEIHITHKTTHPFTEWRIERLAVLEGLYLVGEAEFDRNDYPGYSNKRGSGGRLCDSSFPIGQSSTYMFKKCFIAYCD